MNGEQPKIEIFAPFGAAYEMMRKILFQPFDFSKWLIIGFAAFLSGARGMGFGPNLPSKRNWNFKSISHTNGSISDSMPSWFFPMIIVLVVLAVIIAIVFMWLSARGGFIFTDCVVKNQAAIVVPWKEYRREGNSLFFFSLLLGVIGLVIISLAVGAVVVPMSLFHDRITGGVRVAGVVALILGGFVGLVSAILVAAVTSFMVPIMYRQRCLARVAFVNACRLIWSRPGPFALYILFWIVLIMGLVIISSVVSCCTCCIAALPYVSSVVLLPVLVCLLAFKLLFLRQFGPEFDVWAVPAAPVPVLPEVPSLEPPPPTE